MRTNHSAGGHAPHANQPGGPRQTVRVGSPGAVLSIVPHLLGFVPARSLIVIGAGPPRDRIHLTLRYDLPDPPDQEAATEIASHAISVLTTQHLTVAVAIGYGPGVLVTPVADRLRASAARAGLDLRDLLRVEDGRYWSYLCQEPACCPPGGVPFGRQDPAADAMASAGEPVLPDRATLAATVAPIGGSTAPAMREATIRAETRAAGLLAATPRPRQPSRAAKAPGAGEAPRTVAEGSGPESRRRPPRRGRAPAALLADGSPHPLVAEGLAAVAELIGIYRRGGRFASLDQLAWLSVVLASMRVRDDAWARMIPAYREPHRRLWTDVVRRASPEYVPAPASLLAFTAWQSGNGALANVALDRALDVDPDYSMAVLLRQAIDAGAPPSMAVLPMTPEDVARSYADTDSPVPCDPGSGRGTATGKPGRKRQ